MKINPQSRPLLLTLFFLIALGGFSFFGIEAAKANVYCGYLECVTVSETNTSSCYGTYAEVADKDTCDKKCQSDFKYTDCPTFQTKEDADAWVKNPTTQKAASTATESSNDTDVCKNVGLNPKTWFDCFLIWVLRFLAICMEAAVTLFYALLDPQIMYNALNNQTIYSIWTIIRDLFNALFILILLFSAFATIFQVEKYNYKKVLLMLILMALLVNFSFPISRFIVDVANSITYFWINNMGLQVSSSNMASSTLFTDIAKQSELAKILYQPDASADTSYLIASVVFVFIFMVTIMITAILFLVRLVVLMVLIIFSPLGFAGVVVPTMEKQASDWWANLFKHAFFAPNMVLMIAIATKTMSMMQTQYGGKMNEIAKTQAGSSTIAAIAMFLIPIIILWIGLGFAQSMSVIGGDVVTKRGKDLIGWAGRTFSGYRAANYGIKKAGEGATFARKAAWNMFDRDVLAKRLHMSPKTMWDAWKARREEINKQIYGPETGRWHDKIHKFFGEDTRHADQEFQKLVAEKERDFEASAGDTAYLYEQYKKARAAKKTVEMTALLRIIAKMNEGNFFMLNEGLDFDPFATTDKMIDDLVAAGMDEHDAVRQVQEMGLTSVAKGMTQLHGAAGEVDPITGKYRRRKTSTTNPDGTPDLQGLADRQKRVEAIQSKINEVKAQTWADTLHWTSFFVQNADGSTGRLHEVGASQLENLTGEKLLQMSRIRGDATARIYDGLDQIKTLRNDLVSRAQTEGNLANAATAPQDKARHLKESNRLHAAEQRLTKFIDNIERLNAGEKLS